MKTSSLMWHLFDLEILVISFWCLFMNKLNDSVAFCAFKFVDEYDEKMINELWLWERAKYK